MKVLFAAAIACFLSFHDLRSACRSVKEGPGGAISDLEELLRTTSSLEERYSLWYDGFDDMLKILGGLGVVFHSMTLSLLDDLYENIARCKP
jgi:hypothetical protein